VRKVALGNRVALVLLALSCTAVAGSSAPDWLREIARAPLPSYPAETRGVVLLDEQIMTVSATGEIHTLYRRAVKILSTSGRDLGIAAVYFDNETKINHFKAWSIPAQGAEYEVKDKDALETTPFSGSLYEDNRLRMIRIPASEPGSVVGYEYEQRNRPYVLQDVWLFQEDIPVRKARFVLDLPPGWELESHWINRPKQDAAVSGNQHIWEVNDISAIKDEPGMPAHRAVAQQMAVSFFSSGGSREKSHGTWNDVGAWMWQLSSTRRQATPEMQQKAHQLTDSKANTLDKIRALGAFAQRDVRYVAIEIGIGGYQPHMAPEIFSNRYGDCKDKVTLLATMLREVGINSYYVLAQTRRGVIVPSFPSAMSFNHVIIAIPLSEKDLAAGDNLYSVVQHPKLGRLLIFDPTSDFTPVGHLPSYTQGNFGLLVSENAGELIELPLQAPVANQLKRTATVTLNSNGMLSGQVREVRTGTNAVEYRGELLSMQAPQRVKKMEAFLGTFLTGFSLKDYQVEGLENYDKELVVNYSFEASNYAKQVGGLLLVRPRVFGSKGAGNIDLKERKYEYELGAPTLQTDEFNITLPAGFVLDELPAPVKVSSIGATYKSEIKMEGNVLSYKREFMLDKVAVPLENLKELNSAYRQISADERNSAVFKRAAQ
jgi:hypothetical protein